VRGVSRGPARQYARALLEVAEEGGDDSALRIREELRDLAALAGEHPQLRAALNARGVTLADRGRVLAAIAEGAGASPLLSRLLRLLASRDHLSLLPAVAEVYGELVNASRGILPVEVTGAVALSEDQRSALVDAVRGSMGSEIELTTKVAPEVLGGLRVTMGGRTYDGTVDAQLRTLRRTLASGS
jgi:F-type H+-transporting ATPase subunit delta